MNDTTRRFLNGVLARVPEMRIVEVRLFPAMRQGGVESGVAVLAMEQGFDEIPDATAALDLEEPGGEAIVEEAPGEHEVAVATSGGEVAWDESALDGRVLADPHGALPVELYVGDDSAMEQERALEVASEGIVTADRPVYVVADATAGEVELDLDVEPILADVGRGEGAESIALGDILALPAPAPTLPARDVTTRLAILCARYRLILKGPERGAWDLEIVHQADAPLATLDRVISGVVRRSGETAEPERFTAESLRAALDAPPWVEGAAA